MPWVPSQYCNPATHLTIYNTCPIYFPVQSFSKRSLSFFRSLFISFSIMASLHRAPYSIPYYKKIPYYKIFWLAEAWRGMGTVQATIDEGQDIASDILGPQFRCIVQSSRRIYLFLLLLFIYSSSSSSSSSSHRWIESWCLQIKGT
jgi:hypothetical protein